MKGETIGRLVFTVIVIAITWLIVYLIKNKLNNPESNTSWSGIAALGFVALIFIFFSGAAWFGVFIQSKSKVIEADFVGVRPDTILTGQNGEKIYQWRLECRWNDPMSGKQITFTSEPFKGTDLYYNRSKISVSVYPDKADTFYEVDLSPITSNQEGIRLITEKLLAEAELRHTSKQEEKQAYDADQELRKEKSRGLAMLLNRIVFAGTALLILIALVVGGWLYVRHRASQNRIQEFVSSTEQQLQKHAWNFSFSPATRPWRGLMNLKLQEEIEPYPAGFCTIQGKTKNIPWTLEVSIKDSGTGGYYQSLQDQWLRNASYSRLVIPTVAPARESFLVIVEIPKFFPDKVKSALERPLAADGRSYLNDITSVDDQRLVINYIDALFFSSAEVIYKSAVVSRSVKHDLNTTFLSITNIPDQVDQIIDRKITADLKEISKSEKGGYGILISREGIIVSTLSMSLKPDEVQKMIDLGLAVKLTMDKY